MNKSNARRSIFANRTHLQIMLMVYCAGLLPMISMTCILSYFFKAYEYHKIKIVGPFALDYIGFILFVTPVMMILHLVLSHHIARAMVGPQERIVEEIYARVYGQQQGPIAIRNQDALGPLVAAVNALIARREQETSG